MRYGYNQELKDSTLYFTEETQEIIERYDTLRYLGVTMSDTATFI